MQCGGRESGAFAPAEVSGVVMGNQEPSFSSAPAYESSRGREAVEFAASAGLVLDEWQQRPFMDALGCTAEGKWTAFEVGVNVPRQNGKGGIIEARELAGLFLFEERLIMHSSHEFQTSMEAMIRMEELLEESGLISELRPRGGVSRSHGSEGFTLKSGQRLRYRTRTKGGGRGFTGTTLILDEAMVLPESFIGALLPTLSGQSVHGNPQVWYTGSAVDQEVHEHGIVFARIRERGLRGDDPSLAYFEWSGAPATVDGRSVTPDALDAEDLADPGRWAAANPALGVRISAEHIEKELRSMDARTFAVERLGVGDWPRTDRGSESVIEYDDWVALEDIDSAIMGDVCFAFDVTPDRSRACIAVCGRRADDRFHLEVVQHHRGTGWVVPRLAELVTAHRPRAVICDSRGPAASLLSQVKDAHLAVETVSASEYAQACGSFADAVAQKTIRHLGTAELAAAIKGAATRPLGDAWAWSRRSSKTDISPLVATTFAYWASNQALSSVYQERGLRVFGMDE